MPRITNGGKEETMERPERRELGWNQRRGNAWVDLQPILDRLFHPLEQILADAVMTQSPLNVLDVGCGTGATTLAIAKRLAPLGDCTGIDISEAMVSYARQRAAAEGAENAQFLAGDAQRHSFAVGSFDAIASRFGVMFFDDPEAAFVKISNAVSPGGALTCLAWRSREENAFMTAAERAAGPLLGWNEQPDHDAPGQFAWGDPDRINRILAASGWKGVEISPLDVSCTMAKADLHIYARRMGRVGMILSDLDNALRDSVSAALNAAFEEFLINDLVRFQAACWMVKARSGNER
jgi:SAM-dependent methyltransferase